MALSLSHWFFRNSTTVNIKWYTWLLGLLFENFCFYYSSGMGKSKLTDAFGKNCLIINFILCKNNGYPHGNTKILQFMLLEPPDKVKESIKKLP